jgi:hypothetical protein
MHVPGIGQCLLLSPGPSTLRLINLPFTLHIDTKAISGHSVPIVACVAAGAAAIIHLFGPEYIGGVGDFGARVDAEAARTGLSPDDIGRKVHSLIPSF